MTRHSFLQLFLIPTFLLAAAHSQALAEVSNTEILERSTSGRTVRVVGGGNLGIRPGEAVLLQDGGKRLASGRVLRTTQDSAIVYVVEEYVTNDFQPGQSLNLLHGVPLADVPELPAEAYAQDSLPANPGDEQVTPDGREFSPKPMERLFTPDGRSLSDSREEEMAPYTPPDVDEDRYNPEKPLRPRYPSRKDFTTHNLTLGVGLFRNREIVTGSTTTNNTNTYITRQGYALRYAYNFETHLWNQGRPNPALLSFEIGWGIYNFVHSFSNGASANVRVMPISGSFRYLIRANRSFKIYPYAGYQNNLVSATDSTSNASTASLSRLQGGRLMGGAGAMLVTSETIDARVEAGTDGILMGLVVKF